jgi:Holliday junction resolvasome RuvABC endonuclease subunit
MILTLDVAFANCGFAVIKDGRVIDFGTIVTEKDKRKSVKVSDDYASRCTKFAAELKAIIQEHKIKAVVGELPSGSQSAVAAKMLGGATGVVVAVTTCFDLPVEWISEGDSKKAALGKRTAKKEEVMDWARNVFPGYSFPKTKKGFEHIADALMAYCGLKEGILIRAFG